jgi:hypothetical protein
MKLFFLVLPFMCMTSMGPKPVKKTKPVQKKETKTEYQFPSAFIFSFN